MSQSSSSSLKKHVYITAEQKYEISAGQVSDILKESDKWLSIDPNSYQAKLKRPHTSPVVNIEDALILWIQKALECNVTITGTIIQQKALRFAELLGNNDFKASIGWLDKFKQRYSIKEYNKHGESQSAPIEKIPQMREELKKVLMKYNKEDIFNCDETGLYWKPL